MRTLRAIDGSLRVCFFFLGPCLRAPGRGEPGFRGGPRPVLFRSLIHRKINVDSSHCFTCKTGFAQIHDDG